MRKEQWYLICNRHEMVAISCLQLPQEWRDIDNMWDKSDEELEKIYEVSEATEPFTILSIEAARTAGFQPDSIDNALMFSYASAKAWVRTMRVPVLAATDIIASTDRWATLDIVARRNITEFRNKLRDLTQTNVFDLKWPPIPAELDFIRKEVDASEIERLDPNFIKMLTTPAAPLTIEQIRIDQWLRIHDERERRKGGGVRLVFDGKPYWFWSDEPTRNQYALLQGFIKRQGITDDQVFENWKTMSKEFIPFTPKMLYQVIDSGVIAESVLFKIAEEHNNAMLASPNPAEYDFKSDWPMTYAEAAAKGTL